MTKLEEKNPMKELLEKAQELGLSIEHTNQPVRRTRANPKTDIIVSLLENANTGDSFVFKGEVARNLLETARNKFIRCYRDQDKYVPPLCSIFTNKNEGIITLYLKRQFQIKNNLNG